MEQPITYTAIAESAGISPSYANQIFKGSRPCPRPLAIHLYRQLGWVHPAIADLTDEQISTLETVEPWVSPADRAA